MEDFYGPTTRSLVTYMQIDSLCGINLFPPHPKKKKSLGSLDVRTFCFYNPIFCLIFILFFLEGEEGRLQKKKKNNWVRCRNAFIF